ncbi:WGR domain-containing protein [Marinicellulosiphila megalodicopiae]|uniref:WGR domain-containing protein n=1 Tax=Marinicellulosiphila megalodicopiae TaxID=2724896 RepID=UPI003BB19323
MKIIKHTQLRFTEGKSDKVYEIDLCQLSDKNEYFVNFRYGRFGANLREGSKTDEPVELEKAEDIFNSLLVSKLNKGYLDTNQNSEISDLTVQKSTNIESNVDPRHQVILNYIDTPPKHWPLNRIIWRAGLLNISESADKIIQLIGTQDAMLDYSIAWTLARCADASHESTLESFTKHKDAKIQRVALDGLLRLDSIENKTERFQNIYDQLSKKAQTAMDNGDTQTLVELINVDKETNYLQLLYSLALQSTCCYDAVTQIISNIKVNKQNAFKPIRHILKLSELRNDHKMFALITLKIESADISNWREPLKSDTRVYLRKRSQRTVRKYGETGSSHFVDLAFEILVSMKDGEGNAKSKVENKQYVHQTRQYEVTSTSYFSEFSKYLAFNYILYKHSELTSIGLSGKIWSSHSEEAEQNRSEAFPELWDQQPEKLLSLLLKSKCSQVHDFAIKAIITNTEFCQTIALESLLTLLKSSFEQTQIFAFELLKTLFENDKHKEVIFYAFINTRCDDIHSYSCEWIKSNITQFKQFKKAPLFLLQSKSQTLRSFYIDNFESFNFSDKEKSEFFVSFLQSIVTLKEKRIALIMPDVFTLLSLHFSNYLYVMPTSIIDSFYNSHLETLKIIAVKLTVANKQYKTILKPERYAMIEGSNSPEMKGLLIEIFGLQDKSVLLKEADKLVNFWRTDISFCREAAFNIIQTLANDSESFSNDVFQLLFPDLFLSEIYESSHDHLTSLFTEILQPSLNALDTDTIWRLISAKSNAANFIAQYCIKHNSSITFSVKQYAILTNHKLVNIRNHSIEYYKHNVTAIKQSQIDGLRILNSKWDHVIDFALDYFKCEFQDADWNCQLLVSLCDNNNEKIQKMGRDLILKFFKQEDGPEYLSKLSQHPSKNVQLFSTQFLNDFATNNPEKIISLKWFFMTVLSSVYKARVSKNRVMNFLMTESIKRKEIAVFSAEILAHHSVTISTMDLEKYIDAMVQIKNTYPDVEIPIELPTLKTKPLKLKGKHHAV